MIPYRDHNPIKGTPIFTIILIVINVLVFLYELLSMANGQIEAFITTWAIIPADLTSNPSTQELLTVITAMFMHGGWAHLIGNMLYLWIFGDNMESTLGAPLFLGFYLVCGIAATIAQIMVGPGSTAPNLGASGAIAGVLGGYMVRWPQSKVEVIIPSRAGASRALMPAIVVLGMWIVLQLFQGFGSLGVDTAGGGVAYFAHIGGFIAGLAIMGMYRLMNGQPQPRIA